MDPVCVADFERLAEERLEPGAFGYYAGGSGDELALSGNAEGWRALRLRPRVLVDVSTVTAATTVLGTPVSMPLLVAPTAIQKLAHPDAEPGMARAAAGRDGDVPLDPGDDDACGRRRRSTGCAPLAPCRDSLGRTWNTQRSSKQTFMAPTYMAFD